MAIEIVDYKTQKVIRTIECGASKSFAFKTYDDLEITLDHDKYYARMIEN